jgi:hypothetical protein
MSYYGPEDYEGFYNEPSDFEMKMDDLKKSLLDVVKDEFISEMEKLRKENSELQEIKHRMKAIEFERSRERSELERSKEMAKKEAKTMRLGELLKDYKQNIYKSGSVHSQGPKCCKCDDDRQIYYTTPLGRRAKEWCTCDKTTVTYSVKEVTAAYIEHWSAEYGIKVNYYDDSRDEVVKSYQMYEPGEDFEKLNSWTYFSEKEDCQKYCDWLTNKAQSAIETNE